MATFPASPSLHNRVADSTDFRSEDGVFRTARSAFTDEEIFELEMEALFGRRWIYGCHESQIANPNDFYTFSIGKQPILVTRDAKGTLHAFINACQHRGATLARARSGNQAVFACSFHGWCYKSDGRLVKVKAEHGYNGGLGKQKLGLKEVALQSYKGFIFVNLDTDFADDLESFLGDAKFFIDLLVMQSPTGDLEVVSGSSAYTFDGNWKLQTENGLDGYHVSTVHYNYVATVQNRAAQDSKSNTHGATLDYSKLGASDPDTDDGWFAFRNGHAVIHSDMPNPEVRPGYASVYPRLVHERGELVADWALKKLRNLNIYPSVFLIDQISTQIRVVRPIDVNKTEIHSFCLGVKGESKEARTDRIRQFEDFFNVSGLGTPDDLVEFKEIQKGFGGSSAKWNDVSRGCSAWTWGPNDTARQIGIAPLLSDDDITSEGLYVNQHNAWRAALLSALETSVSQKDKA